MEHETLFKALDYAGVAVFAATGALAAARRRHDIVTFAFFAAVTGVGGGTLRDLLIGAPVFWVQAWGYLAVCLLVAVAVWLAGARTWRMTALLWLDAVGMAIHTRHPDPGLVHHTDRGSQYTSYEFGKALRNSGLLASMGRVGSAYDNAMAESVFATLKTELVYRQSWPTRHQLEMEVFSYLEGFYNIRRRHSRLNNLSPTNYETLHMTQNEVSA